MEIVIDKSYLQGASRERVRRLCEENTVLLTETLFYELLTTAVSVRAACFAKLLAKDNAVVLIPRRQGGRADQGSPFGPTARLRTKASWAAARMASG